MAVALAAALTVCTPAMANLVADPGFDDAAAGSGTWGKWGAVDFQTWGGNNPEWWGDSVSFYPNTEGNSGGIFDWGIEGDEGVTYDISVDFWIQEVFDATISIGFEYMAADNNTVIDDDFLVLTAGDVYISDGTEPEEWMRWHNYSYTAGSPAPAGTEYVRPVIKYGDTGATSNQWMFVDNVEVTPEPASLALLAVGLVVVSRRRRA